MENSAQTGQLNLLSDFFANSMNTVEVQQKSVFLMLHFSAFGFKPKKENTFTYLQSKSSHSHSSSKTHGATQCVAGVSSS